MEKLKENSAPDFIKMIRQSWTFDRMTDEEQDKCIALFTEYATQRALCGNYYHRWHICQAIYNSYLIGIGYKDWNWREPNREAVPF